MIIGDLYRYWTADCSAAARRLGLAHEHISIARRHERVREAWAPHLAASREAILAAAEKCAKRDRVLVIGAGDCLDVPVADLARLFSQVVLADIVVGKVAREWVRRRPGKIQAVAWDASGALDALAKVSRTLPPELAPAMFTHADPGPPPGGEPDLVVSANCISQLGLVPGHSLPATKRDADLPERCAVAAARRHRAWLAERSGVQGCWPMRRDWTSGRMGDCSSGRICTSGSVCRNRIGNGVGIWRRFPSGRRIFIGCTKWARGFMGDKGGEAAASSGPTGAERQVR